MNPKNCLELGKEYPPANECELIEQMLEANKRKLQQNSQQFYAAKRQQHSKSHGCVEGKLKVEATLPDALRIGIFREAKTYTVLVRFSNGNAERDETTGQFHSDILGDGRGMAIKLLNVEGEKVLVEPKHDKEQDFIALNTFSSPQSSFFVRNVQDYIYFNLILANIKAGKIVFKPHQPPTIPSELEAIWTNIAYAFDKLLPVIKQKDVREFLTSPLDIPYWSTTPYQLGLNACKFRLIPQHQTPTFDPKNAKDVDNYLKEAMIFHLTQEKKEAVFDFEIQLQKDAHTMPIEDPTVEWDETLSPYLKVATLTIAPQFVKPQEFDENLGFSPWHSLPAHKPLGGINRARKRIYTELARLRRDFNEQGFI